MGAVTPVLAGIALVAMPAMEPMPEMTASGADKNPPDPQESQDHKKRFLHRHLRKFHLVRKVRADGTLTAARHLDYKNI